MIATIPVGTKPYCIAYNPFNNYIYVNNIYSNTVSVIDSSTNTVIGNPIAVGNEPIGIAYNSANHNMYVTNYGSNTVSVITTIASIPPPSSTPTGTTITSAIDGNGNPVPNGGSTVSTSITFHVTSTQGTYPINGFQFSLDGKAFEPCAVTDQGIITYNNLAAGL